MIRLIIKGGLHAAIAAAHERGIKLDTIAQPATDPMQTMAGVSDDKLGAVTRWYNEDCGRAPFPAGTLLLFSHIKSIAEIEADLSNNLDQLWSSMS
jgi:hypothetical protein